MSLPNHVLIVGAGLAGPALALALAKQSIKSTILERRPYSQDIGGVIFLAANAMRVMDKVLGIEGRLRRVGYSFDAIEMYTQGNGAVGECDKVGGLMINGGEEKVKVQGLSIGRPVLHDILLEECERFGERIQVKFGAKVSRIEETGDGVTAFMEDGSKVTGDILIGADGIGSIVRKHILRDRDPAPIYSGVVSLGCIVPRTDFNLPKSVQLPAFFYTKNGTFLSFSMDPKADQIQWATSIKVPERAHKEWEEYRTTGQAVSDLRADYAGVTLEPIRSLVDHLNNENVRVWAPYEVPDIPTWHSDRVCILGDAAHAVPPSVGQGTAQAMEDIGLLSRLLSSPGAVSSGYPKLFSHFEKTRRGRTEMVRKAAARAEAGRGKTESSWMWWVKSTVIWAGLRVFGNGGYVSGSKISGYDVTVESIEVA